MGLYLSVRVDNDAELRRAIKELVADALKGDARAEAQRTFHEEAVRKVAALVEREGKQMLAQAMRDAVRDSRSWGSDPAVVHVLRETISGLIRDEMAKVRSTGTPLDGLVRQVVREELARIVKGGA